MWINQWHLTWNLHKYLTNVSVYFVNHILFHIDSERNDAWKQSTQAHECKQLKCRCFPGQTSYLRPARAHQWPLNKFSKLSEPSPWSQRTRKYKLHHSEANDILYGTTTYWHWNVNTSRISKEHPKQRSRNKYKRWYPIGKYYK